MDMEFSKGYFPKIGQTKKFFVEGLCYLKLTGIDVGKWDAIKRWKMEGYFDDFSFFEENEMDNPRVRIKIVGSIWLKSEKMYKRWVKTYQYEIDEVIVNGETVMTETGRKEWIHSRYEPIMKPLKIVNWGGENTQKECLNDIVRKTLKDVWFELDKKEEVEPPIEERKPKTKRNIPLVAGISAGLASLWYFFTK